MAKYYIDLNCGSDENDGLCADKPKKTPAAVKAEAGDKVYIKRGGFCRGWLSLCSGTPDAPVEYLTYGEGAKPIFSGNKRRFSLGGLRWQYMAAERKARKRAVQHHFRRRKVMRQYALGI